MTTDPLSALIRDTVSDAIRDALREELPRLRSALPDEPDDNDPDEVLTTADVARLTGISPVTLARWRHDDSPDGPPWIRIGARRVGYRRRDLTAWLTSRVSAA